MQIKKPRSEEAAKKDSQQGPMRPDWYPAEIREAVERQSKKGRDMIEVLLVVADGDGREREFRDYLVDASVSQLKLRHACEAVGALGRYEAGTISQADFPGHHVRVKIETEKRRGWPERSVIVDYAADLAASGVVPLVRVAS